MNSPTKDAILRVWNVKDQVMVYVNDIDWFKEHGVDQFDTRSDRNYWIDKRTGASDRHGQPIFENDIIAVESTGKGNPTRYIVHRDTARDYWGCTEVIPCVGTLGSITYYSLRARVIGNRRENPELVTETIDRGITYTRLAQEVANDLG